MLCFNLSSTASLAGNRLKTKKKDDARSDAASPELFKVNLRLILSEVCDQYGWTVDHCLSMPATRFFAMLRGARYMRAYLFSELCDIACIPMQSTRYYQGLKRVYQSQIERDDTSRSTRSAPVQRKGLDGEDAKNLMMDLFYRLKRARA